MLYQRRFSRAAIIGACWAPLILIFIVLAALWVTPVVRVTSTEQGVSAIYNSLLIIIITVQFFLLGLTAPFGTTILGFVAITHIRYSAGRLYGMGLALFDALLFPLVALDIAIFGFLTLLFRIPAVLPLPPISLALLSAVPICIVFDILIIRWAWRKVNLKSSDAV